ncbi:hypothetical protein SAMN05216353_11138 [Halobacillus alkaliphilus]|uniref:Uncharacterized protein n=1 Tax=Halobacillus alkaliphilus TaxID=396056 RepID=A0A1I2M3D6_9BACI|nr:DUF5995 family protein [Halobacillus alkaliphilus]SFF85975.1 hypothetical protein SAMN05216353_11138 [Halobacillus alkaliphilus]
MKSISTPEKQAESLEESIELMAEHLHILQRSSDYRAVFQHVYLLMTQEMQMRLESGFFEDRVWMERVLVRFAHYYFNAVNAYEADTHCAPAWKLAFQVAEEKQSFVLQDALLGINAHINRDLPMVLHKILDEDQTWPNARRMLHRRRDHERINDVLGDLVDIVQDELTKHYASLLRWIDVLMGRNDETLSSFFMANFRTNVWYNVELLLDVSSEAEFKEQQERIDEEAYRIGLQIANSPFSKYRFVKSLAPFMRKYHWF